MTRPTKTRRARVLSLLLLQLLPACATTSPPSSSPPVLTAKPKAMPLPAAILAIEPPWRRNR